MKEVVRAQVLKLLDAGITYLTSTSSWDSHVKVIPKNIRVAVVTLIPTRVTIGGTYALIIGN